MSAVAAAGEDVGGGDDLAESYAADKERERAREEALCKGKAAEADEGSDEAEEDSVTQTRGYGGASDEGPDELGEEQQAGLGVGEVPLMGEVGEDGAEQHGAHTREQKTCAEPGRRRA